MELVLTLFIVLFVGINLVQGTLLVALAPLVLGFVVYVVLCSLGPVQRGNAVSDTRSKLEKDLELLGRCRGKWLDSHVCLEAGAKEVDIRRDIHQTKAALELLNMYRGGHDPEVEALFNGRQPTRIETSMFRSELQERLRTLQDWIADSALREVLYTTGRFYTPDGVKAEIRVRRNRIATLETGLARRGGADARIAGILGVITALFPTVGLIGTGIYIMLYYSNK